MATNKKQDDKKSNWPEPDQFDMAQKRSRTQNKQKVSEDSPLGAVGFSDKFINSVYRFFNIKHTEIPEPKTGKPKANELKQFVFLSKTNSGKAFAVGMGDRSTFSAPTASIIIDNEGKVERKYMSATKALAQVAKGEYYAIPFANGGWTDRVRGQSSTEYKRENPKDGRAEDPRSKTEAYMNHVESLYGPRIRGEMNKVADFVFANMRRFSKQTSSNLRGTSHQERVLDIANKLEAVAKEPFSNRIQGSWDRPSYMEQYLNSLSQLNHGWGSIPNNYRQFAEVMDTTPAGLAKFAKFILSTVHAYEEQVKNMLASEVMNPLKAESIVREDDGGTCSSAIATGPAQNLFAQPQKRVKETTKMKKTVKEAELLPTKSAVLHGIRVAEGVDPETNEKKESVKKSAEKLAAKKKEKTNEGRNHLCGKFEKDGKKFHLWNDGEYQYSLTTNGGMDGPQKVKRWHDDSIENIQAELAKYGYSDLSGDLGESSLGADFMDMISNMKNKDGSPKYPNAKLRDGPQPRKPEVSGPPKPRPASVPHPGDAMGPADWYDQSSGGKRNMGDSVRDTMDEGWKEVPTHSKSGKPNANHPNFAKHDAEFKAQRAASKAPRAPAKPKLTLNDIWRKVEDVVGQVFPDGDPIDWMIPWFQRQGIDGHKIGELIARAAKANGYKDMYDYWDQLKAQMDADAAYDAGQH
jgi:hypothetical protein